MVRQDCQFLGHLWDWWIMVLQSAAEITNKCGVSGAPDPATGFRTCIVLARAPDFAAGRISVMLCPRPRKTNGIRFICVCIMHPA